MAQRFTPSIWLACGLLGTALLAGCSQAYKPSSVQIQNAQTWYGRMGLQVHDPMAQEQSFSASFQLQGSAERGSLDVFNPLGSQIAKLQWQPGAAYLQQGERITASDSLDALVQQSLGTSLPVPALFSWLQGQSASVPGWQVDLSRHTEGRITAQRLSPSPQATLRVVLDHAN